MATPGNRNAALPLCLLAVFAALHPGAATAAPATVNEYPGDPVAGAAALISRVFPAAAAQFQLELLPQAAGAPAAMQLDANQSANKVVLRGTGGVEIASAFNWYLNDYLNATYDWNTYAEGQLPTSPVLAHQGRAKAVASDAAGAIPLPMPATSSVKPRRVPYSYYLNVCTYGRMRRCRAEGEWAPAG